MTAETDVPVAGRRRFVVDTSVFVGLEQDRLERFPVGDQIATNVVTLGELTLGVLHAKDTASRNARLRTLTAAQQFECLGIDADVAEVWAQIVAQAKASGRRARVNDCWIAAIAKTNGATVLTQDRDFEMLDVDVVTL